MATSVKNPANCSTKPINERSSEILVGRGNCDNALSFPSSMVFAMLNVVTNQRETDWQIGNFPC